MATSKNERPSLTSMKDLGPEQPIVVPRPPFSLITTSLFNTSLLQI